MKFVNRFRIGQILAVFMAALTVQTGNQPLFAQEVAQAEPPQVKVADITLLPPAPDEPPQLTNGQILVASQAIYNTPLNGSFVNAMRMAKTRRNQEEVVIKFMDPEMLKKFQAMNEITDVLVQPEELAPMTDPKEALAIGASKQPFIDLSDWGQSPFGPKIDKWEDCRTTYQATMEAMIQRSTFSDQLKAEWVDTLEATFRDGLDGRFSKVDDATNWPLWQWTTGRAAPSSSSDRIKGLNIRYTGEPSKVLALFLKKSGVWVLHGFDCHCNPILPYTGTIRFTVTKDLKEPKPVLPSIAECQLLANGKPLNPDVPLVAKPGETVVLTGNAIGDTTNLQLTSEWYLNGQTEPVQQTKDFGGTEDFILGPKSVGFLARRYEGLFSLTDQLGRRTNCPFYAEFKAIPPAPPVITAKVPPDKGEPKKHGHGGRTALIVAAVAGGILAAVFIPGGGHAVKTAIETIHK